MPEAKQGDVSAPTGSFVAWRQLGKQVRPIALDDSSHVIVNRGDVVQRLDLLVEHFEFLGAQ